MKIEQKTEDMIEILTSLNKYLPIGSSVNHAHFTIRLEYGVVHTRVYSDSLLLASTKPPAEELLFCIVPVCQGMASVTAQCP